MKFTKFTTVVMLLSMLLLLSSCGIYDKYQGFLTSIIDFIDPTSDETVASEVSSTEQESSTEIETSTEIESSSEEKTTVEETETTERVVFDESDFVGVWQGSTKNKTTIVLYKSGYLDYYEFGNPFYDYNKGRIGSWYYTDDGYFQMEITLSRPYTLCAYNDHGSMYLECLNSDVWNPETVCKADDLTLNEVQKISEYRCQILLPDSIYELAHDDFQRIEVKDTMLIVYASVRPYLVYNGEMTTSLTGRFEIPIMENCASNYNGKSIDFIKLVEIINGLKYGEIEIQKGKLVAIWVYDF